MFHLTGKERLEKIKERAELTGVRGKDYETNNRLNDIDWLIEQTERAQELEHLLDQDSRQAEIESLHVEILRCREVLRSILNNDETYITNEEIILDELERGSE